MRTGKDNGRGLSAEQNFRTNREKKTPHGKKKAGIKTDLNCGENLPTFFPDFQCPNDV